jgi:WD40 repeat protein/serine/threonine protein kinase
MNQAMAERIGNTPPCPAPPDAPTASGGRLASVLVRDQQRRWELGEPIPVESYLRRHPELCADGEGLLDLICGEWAARERCGASIQVEEYVQRFPELEKSLRMQWEVHAVCRAMRRETSQPTRSMTDHAPAFARETSAARTGLPDVPGYDVLEVIGHGGMGIVYKARHLGLNRLVALKMLRAGTTADHNELARFQLEAEAVARLQHPHIVQVFDFGSWQPSEGGPAVPYLSLEFVDGGSLAKRLADGPQPPRAAAETVETLARAMHYAHLRDILHRDLKPANVLLQKTHHKDRKDTKEGKEDVGDRSSAPSMCSLCLCGEFFTPKIVDFGLAKRLDLDSDHTRTGAVMGTPSYMAPEQAEGRAKDVSRATDVYALGAILYEMLTGRPPFKGTSILDTLEQVKLLDPVVPRRLQPGVPRDLDTICLKCLTKEPHKRYATTAALADDLRRFLDGKPILARPTPAWEQIWKAAKRRPGISALLLLVLAVTIGGFLGILAQWRRAEGIADERGHMAYLLGINATQQFIERDNTPRALELLESLKPRAGRADLRGFEWYYLNGICHGETLMLPGHGAAAISPDGRTIAVGGEQGTVLLHDARGREIAALKGHTAEVTALVFTPNGKLLVSAAKDRTVRVWDWQAGTESVQLPKEHTAWPMALAMSPDGGSVVSGGMDRNIFVWDLVSGAKRQALRSPSGAIAGLALQPGGRMLAAATTASRIWLWDLNRADAEPASIDHESNDTVQGLAFSPNGEFLASAREKTIRLWNVASRKLEGELKEHTGTVRCLAFSSTGNWLAAGGNDRTIRVWDVTSLPDSVPPPLVLRGHRGFVMGVAFDGSGRQIVSAGNDGTARLWDLEAPRAEQAMASGGRSVHCLAYSPDGKWLATGGPDKIVRLVDVANGQAITLKGHAQDIEVLAFCGDGQMLASGSEDGNMILWDISNRQPLHTLRGGTKAITGLAFRPDSHLLAASSWDGIIRLWDPATCAEVGLLQGHEGAVHGLAFSPDGTQIASAGADRTVRLWDVRRRAELQALRGHADEVHCLAFSADGKRIASGGKDRAVIVWDAVTGEHLFTLTGHDGIVNAVAFCPTDARRLATVGSPENVIKFWDLDTRQELLTFAGCAHATSALAFHPNGDELAAGGGTPQHGQIKLFRTAPGRAAAK